jgi:hypothetical protein
VNNMNPFIRKIIYIACIGGLLIPLSMVSRPETRDGDGEIQDAGGILSAMRDKNDLSQAKMSDIDPASETMKLASLGLRGVAVNMLWMQAIEHKKKERYNELDSTLQALTKIQPNFVKVWEYQAHNLAYNVSMEFDDYEYRYEWVKKGLAFLKRGIPFNKRDHRVPSKLGFFTGNKFGKSDEKVSFRRMFRKDNDFHNDMSDFINPDDYYAPAFDGHDTWRMAYWWYEISRKMVEEESCQQREGDMLFHMYRPSMVRNQAMSLQEEFRSSESLREIWRKAHDEWIGYGNQEIGNTLGVVISMNKLAEYEAAIEIQRAMLDEMAEPGTRKRMLNMLIDPTVIPTEQRAWLDVEASERTDEQNYMIRGMESYIRGLQVDIDSAIALEVSDDQTVAAEKAVLKVAELQNQIATIDKNATTVNFRYWMTRNKTEATKLASNAREMLYDAEKMWRQSIYDDEYDFDYKTKTKTVIKQGAISLYLNAFSRWADVFESAPELQLGSMAEEMLVALTQYNDMLKVTNREWPEDFPLQHFIDFRAQSGFIDEGLPTTEMLEELRTGRSIDTTDGSGENEIGAAAVEAQKKSKETKSDEPKSDETKSDETKSDETKSDEK